MALRFIGRDINCNGSNCASVWVDESTGDLVFQGWEITDTAALPALGPVAPNEKIVRLPSGMRALIQEACEHVGKHV